MLGFVVALYDEAEKTIENFGLKKDCVLLGKPVYTGKILDKDVALIICGIGKVSAAAATQAVIDRYNPDKIINFGTAGGANDSVKHITLYLIDKCCQYDFDLSELDNCPVGYMCDYDRIYFTCDSSNLDFLPKTSLCTADRFSNKITDIKTVNSLGCSLRDMEGAAIAQVSTSNGLPFISIKGVTDTYDHPATEFYENKTKVCALFPAAIKTLLERI